jgi:hypothetical protein
MVWLGLKSRKGPVIYGRLYEAGGENGAVEETMLPSLWSSVVFWGVEGKKRLGDERAIR